MGVARPTSTRAKGRDMMQTVKTFILSHIGVSILIFTNTCAKFLTNTRLAWWSD